MKTNKEYQAEFKARMKKSGMIQFNSWIEKRHKRKVEKFIASLKESENG